MKHQEELTENVTVLVIEIIPYKINLVFFSILSIFKFGNFVRLLV